MVLYTHTYTHTHIPIRIYMVCISISLSSSVGRSIWILRIYFITFHLSSCSSPFQFETILRKIAAVRACICMCHTFIVEHLEHTAYTAQTHSHSDADYGKQRQNQNKNMNRWLYFFCRQATDVWLTLDSIFGKSREKKREREIEFRRSLISF